MSNKLLGEQTKLVHLEMLYHTFAETEEIYVNHIRITSVLV